MSTWWKGQDVGASAKNLLLVRLLRKFSARSSFGIILTESVSFSRIVWVKIEANKPSVPKRRS
jgi:hypothetical protein